MENMERTHQMGEKKESKAHEKKEKKGKKSNEYTKSPGFDKC